MPHGRAPLPDETRQLIVAVSDVELVRGRARVPHLPSTLRNTSSKSTHVIRVLSCCISRLSKIDGGGVRVELYHQKNCYAPRPRPVSMLLAMGPPHSQMPLLAVWRTMCEVLRHSPHRKSQDVCTLLQ